VVHSILVLNLRPDS